MADLQTPPTVIEIAEVVQVLNRAGLADLALVVRRLAFQWNISQDIKSQAAEAAAKVSEVGDE